MSDKKDDGGPAFPKINKLVNRAMAGKTYETMGADGMSLRDWFAGMALQGLLASGLAPKSGGYSTAAYEFADAMLEVRKK